MLKRETHCAITALFAMGCTVQHSTVPGVVEQAKNYPIAPPSAPSFRGRGGKYHTHMVALSPNRLTRVFSDNFAVPFTRKRQTFIKNKLQGHWSEILSRWDAAPTGLSQSSKNKYLRLVSWRERAHLRVWREDKQRYLHSRKSS